MMGKPVDELELCLRAAEKLLDRHEELKDACSRGDANWARYSMSYADLRAYEIHWLDVLKKFLSEDSTLLKEWYIHEAFDSKSVEFDVAEIRKKVGIIRMVLEMHR